MPKRDILKGNVSRAGDSGNRIYKPPENEIVDSELMDLLLRYYTDKKYKWGLDSSMLFRTLEERQETFVHDVAKLESVIKYGNHTFNQLVIDSLTVALKKESGAVMFKGDYYLTMIAEALFNLNILDEFFINLSDWERTEHCVGNYLKGKPGKPLVLKVYGNLSSCGYLAKCCDFTIFDNVNSCGAGAENCRFTSHNKVEQCGLSVKPFGWGCLVYTIDATDCTFSLMPNAEVENYCAKPSRGNTLRKLNEKGEVIGVLNENGEWEPFR